MSKYNHINSIPIDSIPKEEIAQAIKEWAEGYSFLERLLWSCFINNLETNGCHVGKNTYVGFVYDKDRINDLLVVLQAAIAHQDSQILICPDGGNPLSGPDWYKSDITIGAKTPIVRKSRKFCNSITAAINNRRANNNFDLSSTITLLDFFIGKILHNHSIISDINTFCHEFSLFSVQPFI